MKKLLSLLLILTLVLSFGLMSCGGNTDVDDDDEGGSTVNPGEDRVLSHADYLAKEDGSKVTIEAYVQATQSWYEKNGVGVITVYLQDNAGGYFAYNLQCTKENAAKLTPGTKIKITGTKATWDGEVEIMDGTFTFSDETDRFVASPTNVTALLGTNSLETHMNKLVSFKDLTVAPSTKEGDTTEYAFLYKWDGSGQQGDDIYFNVTNGTDTFSFCVESYLCGKDTKAYKDVEALEVGDRIDIIGFLYWYNGPQPHVISVGTAKSDGVMTYEDYINAPAESPVVIEAYVQATQSWWDGKITMYLQDQDGGYFAYNVECTEENAAKLTPGTKVKITGEKAVWDGEVEVMYGTFEFGDANDKFVATATDVTAYYGTDDLINYMNRFVTVKGLTVAPSTKEGDTTEYAFLYKWNGSGQQGDDIYFNLTDGTNVYSFCIESYLCGKDTDVYKAAEALKVGMIINVEGFLYWYNGAQAHVTSISEGKSAGTMTYEEYINAPAESPVVIEAYVQATQSWWDGKITVYLQDKTGGYFAYNLECTEENAAKLTPGTKIKITGEKAVWDGEVEIMYGTFTFCNENDTYVAPITDVTAYYGTDDLINFMNRFVSVKGLTVAASTKEGDETQYAFLYKWNGSGQQGDDIYFNLTDGTNVYSFCIESYLCGKDTDVYKAAEALKIGDVIDVEGFLYWYNGAQAHVTSITVVPGTDATE